MSREEILKQVEAYYEMEYHNAELVATRNTWAREQGRISATINATLSRCLGVAFFVQQLNIDYETINEIYEKFREKVNKLLDN
jgi:hypothetical protein